FLDDLDEVRDRVDHAADRGRILQLAGAVHLVQPQPDQGLALDLWPADRAADLLDDDRLCHLGLRHSAVASAGAACSRGGRMSATFLPRRLATMRGEFSSFSASKVARTMLYGFCEPSDLATT